MYLCLNCKNNYEENNRLTFINIPPFRSLWAKILLQNKAREEKTEVLQ